MIKLKNNKITMKRKKELTRELSETLLDTYTVTVNKLDNSLYFLIGDKITSDVVEAVSMLMSKVDFNDTIWNINIKNIEFQNISTIKCLFWLSGGYDEWINSKNYNTSWENCSEDFDDRFGNLVIESVMKAKTLGDIRNFLIKNLNLSVLYDFALSKNFIKI